MLCHKHQLNSKINSIQLSKILIYKALNIITKILEKFILILKKKRK